MTTLFTNIGDLTLPQVETLNSGTAVEVSGTVTLNTYSGQIITQSLTTAAGAAHTMTLENNAIVATSVVLGTVGNGTNTGGVPVLGPITPAAGSASVEILNPVGTTAFNGTLLFGFKTITP